MESYGFAIVAIIAVVVPMNPWLRAFLCLVAVGLVVDVICRSPWTIDWRRHHKATASTVFACVAGLGAWFFLFRQIAEPRVIVQIPATPRTDKVRESATKTPPVIVKKPSSTPRLAVKPTITRGGDVVSSQSGNATGKIDIQSGAVQPGGALSVNQSGGVTAGTVNNYQGVTPADITCCRLNSKDMINNQTNTNYCKGEFRTDILAFIDSEVPIQLFAILIKTPGLTSFETAPTNGVALSAPSKVTTADGEWKVWTNWTGNLYIIVCTSSAVGNLDDIHVIFQCPGRVKCNAAKYTPLSSMPPVH